MTPATQKTLLRGIGMVFGTIGTALVGVPESTPWAIVYHLVGSLIATIGGLMVGKSDQAPGDISPTNVTSLINGARKALGTQDAVITIKSAAPPPPRSGR